MNETGNSPENFEDELIIIWGESEDAPTEKIPMPPGIIAWLQERCKEENVTPTEYITRIVLEATKEQKP